MKRLATLIAISALIVPFAVNAQKIKVKKGDVEVEIDLDDVKAMSEVPNTLDAAREAGSTEAEIQKGYESIRTVYIKGRPTLKVAEHFRKTAEEGFSDDGLGDLIRECIEKGMRDEKLVECVIGKMKKKKRVHPVGKAIPKSQVLPPAAGKPPAVTPPPKKLEKEAEHVAKPTGALKGKKIGGKIKKK